MTAWPDPDRAIVARLSANAPVCAAAAAALIARSFAASRMLPTDTRRSTGGCSRRGCRKWSARWRLPTLLHRARIVDRFLDYLVEMGLIASNPVAELRTAAQRQAEQADLAGSGFAHARTGPGRAAPARALRQRLGRASCATMSR